MNDFLCWDRLQQTTNLFYNGSYSSIMFPKYIKYSEFKTIWTKIINTENLTSLGYLFYNCTIIDDNEFNNIEDFVLTDSKKQNESITYTVNLFNNMKVKKSSYDGTEEYIPLTWSTLYNIPNIKVAIGMFANTKIKYPISFDFFHKRRLDNGTTKIVSINNNVAKLYKYDYVKEISNMYSCFANIQLENSEAFNSNGEYNKGQIQYNYIVDEYNTNYDSYYENERIITYDNNGDPIYSDNLVKYDLQQPSEILDIIKAEQQNYTIYQPEVKCDIAKNGILYNIPNYSTIPGMFISPDIFYGCTNNCDIRKCFMNSNITNYNIKVFTGTIPEHLLYSEGHYQDMDLRNSSPLNLITGLNIKPILVYESNETQGDNIIKHNYYIFVPSKFTNYYNLDNVFNFRLLLPSSSVSEVNHFYLFLKDSISSNTSTLSNSLPISNYSRMFGNEEIGWLNFSSNNYKNLESLQTYIHYNLMLDIIQYKNNKDEDIIELEEGSNLNYLSMLKLDNMFTSDNNIIRILSGNLFKDGSMISWSSSYLSDFNNNYMISVNTSYSGISALLHLLLPKNNNHYISITKNNEYDFKVNRSSVINSTDLTDENISMYYINNYPNINFVS